MRKVLLVIAVLLLLFGLYLPACSQGGAVDSVRIVRPSDFQEATDLPGPYEFYSSAANINRRVTMVRMRDWILELIAENSGVGLQTQLFGPLTSGNTITVSGSVPTNLSRVTVRRGGITQQAGRDYSVNGNTFTFFHRNFDGEYVDITF